MNDEIADKPAEPVAGFVIPVEELPVRPPKKPRPRKANGKPDQKLKSQRGHRDKRTLPKPPIRRASKSPVNSHTSAKRIAHQEKVAEALEYRRQGHSYPMIAKQMGHSAGYCYELVAEGLHNITIESATALYTLEMERLNELLASIYAMAAGGDIKSIETCLKIQERIDRLVGLERASDLAAARGTSIQNNITIRLVGMDDDGRVIDIEGEAE